MNTEDYVSYPLALALKKAGFNWVCDHCWCKVYTNSDEISMRQVSADDFNNDDWDVPHCSAPTLSQSQKWLREVHSLHVDISTHGKNYWTTSITGFNDEDIPVGYLHPVNAQAFDNYESALSAGIAAALELIEKKGE